MPTFRDVLLDAKQRLSSISTSASLDTQLLLAEVVGASRSHVIAHPEKELTIEQARQFESLIKRRAQGEPIAYILGRKAFYDREFFVNSSVLIPRPETEHLLEIALDFARQRNNVVAVDIGTGSGVLAVTFAANVPDATVYAVDISPDALEVARVNATKHEVSIIFFEGDLFLPLIKGHVKVDLIMANLPYIASDEMLALDVSKYEPHLALDGGPDGLDLVRCLLDKVSEACNAGALILLEIGASQAQSTMQLAKNKLPSAEVDIHKDYAGFDRVVAIQL